MRTPWKFNVNMGTTFSGVLAVGAEYEYSDYSYINYKDYNGYDLSSSNIATDKYLKGVHTLKLGMEAMLTPSFSFRAGYNYVTSAFKEGSVRYVPNVETMNDKYIWFDETRTDPEYHNIKARCMRMWLISTISINQISICSTIISLQAMELLLLTETILRWSIITVIRYYLL